MEKQTCCWERQNGLVDCKVCDDYGESCVGIPDEEFFKQKALRRARAFPFWLRLLIGDRDLNGDQMYHEIIQETELGKKFVEMEKKFFEWEKANPI